LPGEIELVKRRRAERGTERGAQPDGVRQAPVEPRFVGRVAAVGAHVRVACRAGELEVLDHWQVREQRYVHLAEYGPGRVIARGDARARGEPGVLAERDLPGSIQDLILLVEEPGGDRQGAGGQFHDVAGNHAFHGPLRVLRGTGLDGEQVVLYFLRDVAREECR